MTASQCLFVLLAHQIGVEQKVPELPALIYHESRAGEHLVGDDGASFGLGHMRLSTAKDVLRDNPLIWPGEHKDEEIIIRLLKDHPWAMLMAAKRYRAVGPAAYNAGVEGAKKGRGKAYETKLRDAQKKVEVCYGH